MADSAKVDELASLADRLNFDTPRIGGKNKTMSIAIAVGVPMVVSGAIWFANPVFLQEDGKKSYTKHAQFDLLISLLVWGGVYINYNRK